MPRKLVPLAGAGFAVFAVLILAFGGGATEESVPDRTTTSVAEARDDDIIISGDVDDAAPDDGDGADEGSPADAAADADAGANTGDDVGCDDPANQPSSACGAAVDDHSDDTLPRYSDLPTITLDELPVEALDTLDLIERGGPYPYRQDDGTFFNRERLLPLRDEGHYREYTVETPGSPDRGARRIVAGADGERYWTDDHYASFFEIVFD